MSSDDETTFSFDLFPKIANFPKLEEEENGANERNSEEKDDEISLSSDQIRTKLTELQRNGHTQWDNKNNDKFFFTKLLSYDAKQDESLSDFDNYNKMVQREMVLATKSKRIMNDMNNNTLKVTPGIDTRFKAGKDGDVKHSSSASNHMTKHSHNLSHHNTSSVRKPVDKFDFIDIYQTATSGSNRTEVVDISKLDLSYLHGKREKNGDNYINIGNNGDGGDNTYDMGRYTYVQPEYHIQRKLKAQQIQMIALGGTLGVGLLFSSGKGFSIGGPLGCFLGFLISGSIVLATMLSFAEMSTLIPTTTSISGLASRFVEDAFGFALGWTYWLSFVFALPSEICAATIMLSYYPQLNIPSPSTAGFVSLFLVIIIGINLMDVRVYGHVEYISSLFKVIITVILIISMIVVNIKQHYGFKYWDSKKSIDYLTYGVFRPTFDLSDIGTGATQGIHGALGNFLGVITSVLISSYAYIGSEVGFVAALECKNPRKALPKVTKRVFGRVIILYMLSIFLVGLNIYSGDPRLLRYYTKKEKIPVSDIPSKYLQGLNFDCTPITSIGSNQNGNQSPWIIALQGSGLCSFSSVLNGIFVVFGVSAGYSHLYVSSRTLYSMAIQGKAFKIFTRCSKNGVPYYSVLFSGVFAVLSYLSVNDSAFEVFQYFANISSGSAMLMWAGMCISFLRFYYGLKLRPDIISRDDPSYPYRSPFQPYLAIYGLLGSLLIVIFMGYVVFLRGYWNIELFFTSYGAVMIFVICYIGYKLCRSSKIQRLDQLDLDSGRREMDRIVWDEEKFYISSLKEVVVRWIKWLA